MGLTNYPNGFPFGVTIRGIPILNLYTGKTFWVDSVHGHADNQGTFNKPLASIAGALAKCTANHGDIIICKAGHIETVSAATSCVLSVVGVCVIFLGQGSNKATINLTATGAYVNVTAANSAMISPRFLTGIDAVDKGLQVAAADFFLGGNVEYYDAPAKASTIQVLTTSAALRMVIDGYKYFPSTTGTQKTDGIKTAGDLAGPILRNIDIRGDFSTSPVDVSAAIANLQLENLYLNNTNAGPQKALTLHANCTGFAKNVKCRVASGTSYISSVAKLSWADDCEGFSTDGYGGEPLGTPLSTGVEGKVDSVGVQASTVQSKTDSVGIQASTVSSQVTSAATSVGIGVSTGVSVGQSVGIQASTVQSKADSVGVQTSTVSSQTTSAATSVGIGVSTNISMVDSSWLAISTELSLIRSKQG